MDVLEHHLLPYWPIHEHHHFMYDRAPAHRRSKKMQQWSKEKLIQTIDWAGNSPDLGPIENAWKLMNNKVHEKQSSSFPEVKILLRDLWVPQHYLHEWKLVILYIYQALCPTDSRKLLKQRKK